MIHRWNPANLIELTARPERLVHLPTIYSLIPTISSLFDLAQQTNFGCERSIHEYSTTLASNYYYQEIKMRFKLVAVMAVAALMASSGIAEAQLFRRGCCPPPTPQPCYQQQRMVRQIISRPILSRPAQSTCCGTVMAAPVMAAPAAVPCCGGGAVMTGPTVVDGGNSVVVDNGTTEQKRPSPDPESCNQQWTSCRSKCQSCTGQDLTDCYAHCDCLRDVCNGTNTTGCELAPSCYGQPVAGGGAGGIGN